MLEVVFQAEQVVAEGGFQLGMQFLDMLVILSLQTSVHLLNLNLDQHHLRFCLCLKNFKLWTQGTKTALAGCTFTILPLTVNQLRVTLVLPLFQTWPSRCLCLICFLMSQCLERPCGSHQRVLMNTEAERKSDDLLLLKLP